MTRRVLVYGDVNLNLIDGSAIWTQAMVQALAAVPDVNVRLLLKAKVDTDRLVEPLRSLDSVTIIDPFARGVAAAADQLSAAQAVERMESLDTSMRFDAVVVRGFSLARRAAASSLAGRLWTYLTDFPQWVGDAEPSAVEALATVVKGSRLLLCQTEDIRSLIEHLVPESCGRCVVYPPVIPSLGDGPRKPPSAGEAVRLVYSGKFAPLWNTLEMTGLPRRFATKALEVEMHMVGDKVHHDRERPEFHDAMQRALRESEGVIWHGGMAREKAMDLTGTCHAGLGWRAPELDESLELSTKLLEYGSLGLPVLLNRTPAHEDLLGADYPLFVRTPGDIVERVDAVLDDPAVFDLAANRCYEAAAHFTLDRATERLEHFLDQVFPTAPAPARTGRPLRVGVASHDLKFFDRILDWLGSVSDVDVRLDEWPALAEHDEVESRALVDWADVIVCEWCGPNAIWYSRHKRAGQRLIVRLHRFELDSRYPKRVDIDAVDRVVCVSPHYARLTANQTGWPAEKIVTIPNWVDVDQLDRPKGAGARFHLGMIGIAPARKRMDLALDVLANLRRRDERFMLFVKSKMPWEYWWIWKKEEEREHFDEILFRMQTDPDLKDGVVFDGYGPDVAGWLRKVGHVLSTSDDESFHLSPAEGMASRALPMLLHWPGAETIYPDEWIHEGTDAIADHVFAASQESLEEGGAAAQAFVADNFAVGAVCEQWYEELNT